MDYDIDDVIFASQLEENDLFRYENQDYRVHRLIDEGTIISIRAEVLTDNDDYVTIELDPDTKIELLVVA